MRHTYRGLEWRLALIGFVKLFACGWASCLGVTVLLFLFMPQNFYYNAFYVNFLDIFLAVEPVIMFYK